MITAAILLLETTTENEMYEWEVQYSETKQEGTRISCESWRATVFAEDEGEVRAIMAEEEPGMSIDKITRGDRIDEDA